MLTVLRPEDYTSPLSVCSSALSTSDRKCAYPPVSSACTVTCISETTFPAPCVMPISTMEETSTRSHELSSLPTKVWNSTISSGISEGSSSDVQPVSSSKGADLPVHSYTQYSLAYSETLNPTKGIYSSTSRSEKKFFAEFY